MKKVLVIVVMLLLAMPVMAATTISAVKEGSPATVDGKKIQTVRIEYSSTVDIRAFALEITMTDANGSMKNIRDYNTGENSSTVKGYGIFPSRFRDFINPTGPNWANPNYMPLVAWNEPESAGTGIGFRKWIVEMGTLFAGDGNKPALSGTLFRFDANSEGDCNTATISIVANALRGGIVDSSAAAIPSGDLTFNGTTINWMCCQDIPTITPCFTMTDANTALNNAGFTVGTITYEVNCACAYGTVLRQDTGCYELPHAVNYVVSSGRTVPSIATLTMTDANTALLNAGLTVGAITYQYNDSIAAGIVISQGTAAGTCVANGSAVAYLASAGKMPAPALLYPRWDPDSNIPVLWTAIATATSYQLDRSNNGGSTWSSVYVGTATFKAESVATGFYRYRVLAKNATSTSLYNTGTYDCNAYLSRCYRDGNTADGNWGQWLSVGRPDCWCKASAAQEPNGSGYQCDGDADGTAYGTYRIYSNDLTMLSANWKKTAAQLTSDPNLSLQGKLKIHSACADFDHKAYGTYRLYSADLTILSNNWKKLNSSTATATNRLPGNCPR